MSLAALIISCAAVAVCGYQLYWLRRLVIATRKLRRLRSVPAAGPYGIWMETVPIRGSGSKREKL